MRLSTRILCLLGLALVSACSKSEVDKPDNAISFSPVASKSTKTIISGTIYPEGESFVVSAYHNGTDAYFEDLTASYSLTQNGTKLWATSDDQYWPLSGSLDFHAYSPSSASSHGVDIDATNGVTATGYTVQNNTQMTTDLCYASATVADCGNHPDSVPLAFSHALTQVVFRVKAAAYYTTNSSTVALSMTSLSLSGIYSIGDFASGAWTNQNTAYTYTLSNSETALTYDGSHVPNVFDVSTLLYLPQTIPADARLNVGYIVSQTVSGTTYTVDNPPVSIPLRNTVTEWQPGKKYIYTIKIGLDNLITFTASTVAWDEVSGGVVVE